jgi:hypothetical protein
MRSFSKIIFLLLFQVNLIFSQNTSLNFDGMDDYVEITDVELGNFNYNEDFTISVWVKPDNFQLKIKNPDNDIIEKWSLEEPAYPFVIRYLNQTADDDEGRIYVARYDGTNNPEIFSTHKINDGNWHNIIFTRYEGNLELYIDGQFSGAVPDNTKYNTKNNCPIYLGQRGDKTNHFKGEIDELRIWNRGTASAGQNLNGKTPSIEGLVVAFDFSDGIPNGINTEIFKITDYFAKYTGVLQKFTKFGPWSNFVNSTLKLTNTTQTIDYKEVVEDTTPPTIKLKNLEHLPGYKEGVPGFMITADDDQITIAGVATDDSGLSKVTINDITAEIDKESNVFQANIILDEGRNPVKIIATDINNNKKEYVFFVNKKPKVIQTNNNAATIDAVASIPRKTIKEKRIALIIGNSNYTNLPKLKNPKNDANLMDSTLKLVGFTVNTIVNGDRESIWEAIDNFTTELAKDKETIGLFYYAGHGIQQNGNNYLVPINAKILKPSDIARDCYNMESLYNEIEQAKNNLNMIILDACRNNPVEGFRSAGSGGLAKPEKQAIGTFIAFSTAPGKVAADGLGNNSIYTKELSSALLQSGKKIEDVFKKVKEEVFKASKETQLPWDSSSIFGDFYFKY